LQSLCPVRRVAELGVVRQRYPISEMKQLALTKENSTTIGFVVSCIFAGAIDKQELQAWADHVLVSTDSYPLYIVDLSTFNEDLFHIFRVIGFVPHCDLTETEKDALVGIAFVRGREQFEPVPSQDQALAALAAHLPVLARFRDTFPFISVQYDHAA
jgi:hypothetical protein